MKIPYDFILKLVHMLLNAFWPGHCCACLGCEGDDHVQAQG
jgi:hypothetical protein